MQACKVFDNFYLDWTNSKPDISEKKSAADHNKRKVSLVKLLDIFEIQIFFRMMKTWLMAGEVLLRNAIYDSGH